MKGEALGTLRERMKHALKARPSARVDLHSTQIPKFIQSCKFCAILLAKGRKGGIICGVKTARTGGKPSNK